MKIEILGSGGATLTPRPFCQCNVCQKARAKGIPYSRMGPSYFIHGVNLLVDTPEEIGVMLNRSNIMGVEAAVYSHWHPDHTSGLRIWEAQQVLWDWPRQNPITTIYLPEQVAKDFDQWLDLNYRLAYLEDHQRVIRQVKLAEGESFSVNGLTVTPIKMAVGYVYAFLLTEGNTKVLLIADELFEWTPPADLPPIDLAILPASLFEFNPFTGERIIPENHPVLKVESMFEDSLEFVRQLKPKRTILSHIEEPFNLDYDDYLRLSEKLATEQPELGPVSFAYDMQIITVGE
jgi:phosphoribosyl 1,2-cyclic phosphate phosphodiesterase